MPSARFIAAALSPNCKDVPVELVTFEHPSFDAPLRFCSGGQDLSSLGRQFKSHPFELSAPGEGADRSTRRARVSLANDKTTVGPLRSATTRPSARIEFVFADTPNTIEFVFAGLRVIENQPGLDTIELTLAPRDDSDEMFPVQSYIPSLYPGLF